MRNLLLHRVRGAVQRSQRILHQRAVTGIGEQAWARIEAARAEGPFASLDDFCRRTRLPKVTVGDLIRAGALDAFDRRRPLLWQLGALDYRPEELPLEFESPDVALPSLDEFTHTAWEYELLGLSPHGHFMRHYRGALLRVGALDSVQLKQKPNGRRVRVGGMVGGSTCPSLVLPLPMSGFSLAICSWGPNTETGKE